MICLKNRRNRLYLAECSAQDWTWDVALQRSSGCTRELKLGGFQSQRMCPILSVNHISTKSSLLGVWHDERSKAISTGNKRRIVPHLLSFLNTAPL